MKVLKLLSVLLDYPDPLLWEHRDELLQFADWGNLPKRRQQALLKFIDELTTNEVLQAQEDWLGCFDRGRAMSLLIFEHIYGESRDRGQAMVDLLQTYHDNGFEMVTRELPDYLPVMLEYLSTRPVTEVNDWLTHISMILELLAARAAERNSPYALLFEVLIEMVKTDVDLRVMRQRAASEERDDTPEFMDAVWEEEAVRFGVQAPAEDCMPNNRLPAGARLINSEARS